MEHTECSVGAETPMSLRECIRVIETSIHTQPRSIMTSYALKGVSNSLMIHIRLDNTASVLSEVIDVIESVSKDRGEYCIGEYRVAVLRECISRLDDVIVLRENQWGGVGVGLR